MNMSFKPVKHCLTNVLIRKMFSTVINLEMESLSITGLQNSLSIKGNKKRAWEFGCWQK